MKIPNCGIEQNYKDFYSILHNHQITDSVSSSEKAAIENIAWQCPIIGGTVVCGESQFDQNVLIKDTLQITKDLIIDENVIVNGDLNLRSQTGAGYDLLWIDDNGKIVRGGGPGLGGQLIEEVYNLDCVQNPDGTYPNPGWHNAPGVIYTDEICPPDVKVGITTSAPQARLHILEKTTTDDVLKLSTLTTPDILVVENTGEVGIGTNDPNALLHIKGSGDFVRFQNSNNGTEFKINNGGKVFCREVKVTTLTIADYVYDDNYDLMTIEEYETYTKENNHLPGVPSQQQVTEQGGIDVGEFQIKLLEKIEELSLYLFELNDKVKKLENENEEYKKKIEELEGEINAEKN